MRLDSVPRENPGQTPTVHARPRIHRMSCNVRLILFASIFEVLCVSGLNEKSRVVAPYSVSNVRIQLIIDWCRWMELVDHRLVCYQMNESSFNWHDPRRPSRFSVASSATMQSVPIR